MANGDIYEGEWKNDELFGIGKKTSSDGTVTHVKWENDTFVEVTGEGDITSEGGPEINTGKD